MIRYSKKSGLFQMARKFAIAGLAVCLGFTSKAADPGEFLKNMAPILQGLPRLEYGVTRIAYDYPHAAGTEGLPLTNYYYFKCDGTNYICLASPSKLILTPPVPPNSLTNPAFHGTFVFGRASNYFWHVETATRIYTKLLNPEPVPISVHLDPQNEDYYYATESEGLEVLRLGVLAAIPFSFKIGPSNSFTAIAENGGKISGLCESGKQPDKLNLKLLIETTKRKALVELTVTNGSRSPLPSRIAVYNQGFTDLKSPSATYAIDKVQLFPQNLPVSIPDIALFSNTYTATLVLTNSQYFMKEGKNLVEIKTMPKPSPWKIFSHFLPYVFFAGFTAIFLVSLSVSKRRMKKNNNQTKTVENYDQKNSKS